jgi:hypothetical protein
MQAQHNMTQITQLLERDKYTISLEPHHNFAYRNRRSKQAPVNLLASAVSNSKAI